MSAEPDASYVETLEFLRDAHLAEIEELRAKLAEANSRQCPDCERLRQANAKLNDDMVGLYERIATGDKRQQENLRHAEDGKEFWIQQYYELDASIQAEVDDQDADAVERYHQWTIDNQATLERLRLLEAEAVLLRRKVGTGRQRGRLPEWTPVQAAQVQELHDAGRSLRETAREAALSVSQVRRILARPAQRPHPATEVDERLANRTRELDKLIRGAQVAQVQRERRATALARAAATKAKRKPAT